jgi:hypothetical protein
VGRLLFYRFDLGLGLRPRPLCRTFPFSSEMRTMSIAVQSRTAFPSFLNRNRGPLILPVFSQSCSVARDTPATFAASAVVYSWALTYYK